jgi:hypothetical protein
MDLSQEMIKKSVELTPETVNFENLYVVGDEEFLPFKEGYAWV